MVLKAVLVHVFSFLIVLSLSYLMQDKLLAMSMRTCAGRLLL
jgi:hypothetical protein